MNPRQETSIPIHMSNEELNRLMEGEAPIRGGPTRITTLMFTNYRSLLIMIKACTLTSENVHFIYRHPISSAG
jgi:hypothetical protein